MSHVVLMDLRDTRRTLELFEDAKRRGLTNGSEADRLNFLAAAERARRVGAKNPCGLLAQIVRRRLLRYVAGVDEDAARRRLTRVTESGGLSASHATNDRFAKRDTDRGQRTAKQNNNPSERADIRALIERSLASTQT